jgi:MFS family permease
MKYRYGVLGLLFLLSIITYLDRVCISVAGPQMQKSLDIPPENWGWVVGIFAVAYALGGIPSGAIGDRIGPRRVLTGIVIWWSAFTTLTGAVSSFVLLLVTQFLFGAGESGASPNSSASISRWFPLDQRARAQGVAWMGSRLGGALSPLFVIPIQMRWGWRASFFAFGVLGIAWAVVWYWWYRDSPSEKRGVTPEEIREIEHGETARARERHALPFRVVRNWNFWAILAMYHTYCWGAYFFMSWLHTFLAKGRGFTPTEIQTWTPLPFVFGMAATLCGGFTSDYLVKRVGLKWGRRTVGVVGLTASAAFMALVLATESKIASAVLLSCAYFCSDFTLPVAWVVCLDVGRKYAGAVTGSMNMAGQFGSFLSSVAFGYLIKYFGTYNAVLPPMIVMLLISAVLWLKVDPTKQLIAEPAGAGESTKSEVRRTK